jgi:hypothetical protein
MVRKIIEYCLMVGRNLEGARGDYRRKCSAVRMIFAELYSTIRRSISKGQLIVPRGMI